jgi:prepilin-type processing-associated H-X9-DG protein
MEGGVPEPADAPGRSTAPPQQVDQESFGSYHPGVCQFAMADGSVRALSNTTAGLTLQALSTRAGGEVVPQN